MPLAFPPEEHEHGAGDVEYDSDETYDSGTVGAEIGEIKASVSTLSGTNLILINYNHFYIKIV